MQTRALDVPPGFDAALRHRDAGSRNEWKHAIHDGEIDHERFEVSIVDADDLRARGEREIQLSLVSNFNQQLQADLLSGVNQLRQCRGGHGPNDDESSRASERPRLQKLHRLDVKILFQHGDVSRRPRRGNVGVATSKASRFRQH
jgi:hypothetical protein